MPQSQNCSSRPQTLKFPTALGHPKKSQAHRFWAGLQVARKYERINERDQNDRHCKCLLTQPYYVCPEAIRHKTYDHRCDIWALGVILYIMITGVPPFSGKDDREILRAVRRGAYNLSGNDLNTASPDLRNLIARILTSVEKRLSIPEILNHPWIRKEPSSAVHKLNFGKIYAYVRSNKMKKLAVNCIASQLSEQDITRLGEVFKQVDKDGDGVISSE